ncbi:MAG TPA: RNA polymerase sigma factor [Phycisphaerales bacterium]|nr:RNA polymerase sigma factor [Phycisphaerales bacterium]
MDRVEEMSLIERAAAGEKAAAELLIRAHQASLYAYMLRVSGRPETAEDIVQDAFVRVLMNLDRFDPRFRFSTWLFTIAKRLYVNACQKHKPVYDSESVGAWESDGDDSPSRPAMESEFRGHARDDIGRALLELSDEQRQIILLFHQQDWPITRIAEYMTMPEGTVKSHLHRGRQRLRKLYEQYAKERGASVELDS